MTEEKYKWNYLNSDSAKPLFDIARKIILKNECKSILDIGCGHSIISSYNDDISIVGIDIDKNAVAYCNNKYNGTYLEMDAVNNLSLDNLNIDFDCILLSGILYYFKNNQFSITQTQFVDRLVKDFSPKLIVVTEPQDRKDYNSPDYSKFLKKYKPTSKTELELDIRMGKRVVYEIKL